MEKSTSANATSVQSNAVPSKLFDVKIKKENTTTISNPAEDSSCEASVFAVERDTDDIVIVDDSEASQELFKNELTPSMRESTVEFKEEKPQLRSARLPPYNESKTKKKAIKSSNPAYDCRDCARVSSV